MAEPSLKTQYDDNYASPASANDENQLTLIGLSDDGPMDDCYSFTGMAGLALAETLFGDRSRLPHAIREAIEASVQNETPITVNVLRGGEGAAKAYLNLLAGVNPAIKLEHAYYGDRGNEWYAKVEHDGADRVISVRFGASGTATQFTSTTNAGLVNAINASSLNLVATKIGDADLTDVDWSDFGDGEDGTMTNAEVSRLLTLLQAEDYPNILFLGVSDAAPVAAIKTHCASMLSDYQVERFAFIDVGGFDSTNDEYSSAWLVDMETYTDAYETGRSGTYLDERNLIPFVGQATFYDATSVEYTANVTVAAAAAWLGLPIHRSMVNVQVPNVVSLEPEIPPSFRNRLADAAYNYLRTEEGRGVIIGNSRTFAADTSDFNKAQILRAIYQCGREAREAGMPKWGLPDHPVEHDGLDALKDAMEIPLERRKGKTIVSYETAPEIDSDTDEVTCRMGIRPYSSMETIDHVVYRKRS